MKKLLTAMPLMCCLAATGAAAPPSVEWTRVASTTEAEIFIDAQPFISLGDSDIHSILTNFSKEQRSADGQVYRSSVISRAIDCENSVATFVSFVLFASIDATGEPIASGGEPEARTVLPAEKNVSTDPRLFELFCPGGEAPEASN